MSELICAKFHSFTKVVIKNKHCRVTHTNIQTDPFALKYKNTMKETEKSRFN